MLSSSESEISSIFDEDEDDQIKQETILADDCSSISDINDYSGSDQFSSEDEFDFGSRLNKNKKNADKIPSFSKSINNEKQP